MPSAYCLSTVCVLGCYPLGLCFPSTLQLSPWFLLPSLVWVQSLRLCCRSYPHISRSSLQHLCVINNSLDLFSIIFNPFIIFNSILNNYFFIYLQRKFYLRLFSFRWSTSHGNGTLMILNSSQVFKNHNGPTINDFYPTLRLLETNEKYRWLRNAYVQQQIWECFCELSILSSFRNKIICVNKCFSMCRTNHYMSNLGHFMHFL